MTPEQKKTWEAENPLIQNPLFKESDLGKAIPGGPYSTSVCLPTWNDNVGLKAGEERVSNAIELSYPRNRMHPWVKKLHETLKTELGLPSEDSVVAFDSPEHAQDAAAYLKREVSHQTVHAIEGPQGLSLLHLPGAQNDFAAPAAVQQYLHDTGHILSARQVEDLLEKKGPAKNEEAEETVRTHLAEAYDMASSDFFLYPNAMAGIYQVYQMLMERSGNKKTVQWGSPYVSTLNIQKSFGPGVHIFKDGSPEELEKLKRLAETQEISAVFTEVPNNPLLKSANLEELSKILRPHGIPLVVDDTLATPFNVDLEPFADLIVTSLTKSFAGRGDVMGGSVATNPASPLWGEFQTRMQKNHKNSLHGRDAEVLAHLSRDWEQRVRQMNDNGEALHDLMSARLSPDQLFYPKQTSREAYNIVRRARGGFGNMISYVLSTQDQAQKFFDGLESTKGISLGTNFTLNSLYVVLAHDHERHVMKQMGLTRHLIRTSAGLESTGDLIKTFEKSLDRAGV
jgi:cystathionine gamma-synthase